MIISVFDLEIQINFIIHGDRAINVNQQFHIAERILKAVKPLASPQNQRWALYFQTEKLILITDY
jgi:hypothetical protein